MFPDYADTDRRQANPTRWEATKASPNPDERGYIAEFDANRLNGQLRDVYDLMKDGAWRTLGEIRDIIGRGSETGISAALRTLRKKPWGYHIIDKRRRGDPKSGHFEYRIAGRRRKP